MTRDEFIRAAREAGFRTGNIILYSGDLLPFVAPLSATTCIVELERFAALIEDAATEKANERANASWALMCEKMVAAEREACTNQATLRQSIDALVGDRLTAKKADHICERDGYAVTGVVLTLPDGRACIVNRSAVRWLHGDDDLSNLMHTDTAINQRLLDDAVQTEREACAKVCDDNHWEDHRLFADAIRARGQK